MKKYMILAAAAAIAAFSCAKEIVPAVEQNNLVEMSFVANLDESPIVKTSLGENGKDIVWKVGDEISLFTADAGANRKFTVESVSDFGRKAVFAGVAEEAYSFYALYPYTSGATLSSGGVVSGVTIPVSQVAVPGSFMEGANPAVAYAANGSKALQFKNVGALLSFSIKEANVTAIEISADQYLSGTATVTYNDGLPTVNITGGSKSVKLTAEGGFEIGKTYYAVIYPTNNLSGLKLSLTKYEAETVVSTSFTFPVKRNSISSFGTLAIPSSKWNYSRKVDWDNGGVLEICGNLYSKESMGGISGTIIKATEPGQNLMMALNGKSGIFYLDADEGCWFKIDAEDNGKGGTQNQMNLGYGNLIITSLYPNKKVTIKSYKHICLASNKGGTYFKDIEFDFSTLTLGYFSNYGTSSGGAVAFHFDGCKFTLAPGKTLSYVGNAAQTAVNSYRFYGCKFFINQSATYTLIDNSKTNFANNLKEVVFHNNIFYNPFRNGSAGNYGWCLLVCNTAPTSGTQDTDYTFTSNTFFNSSTAMCYIRTYELGNTFVDGNLGYIPAGLTSVTNHTGFFQTQGTTSRGTATMGNNCWCAPEPTKTYQFNYFRYDSKYIQNPPGSGSMGAKKVNPFPFEGTVSPDEKFTPLPEYRQYGAKIDW